MEKYTLIYEKGYYSIQDQDLPPIGYHFVCSSEGGYEIRKMRDIVNGDIVANCYNVDIAIKIAKALNEE